MLLFDRAARRRVALTEAGKRIYPTAREIVDRCRALQSNLPEREGNLLTVGASTVPAQYLIPRLLADFSRQRPDCQFLLREPVIARETASGTWLETEKWLRRQGILPERLHILARMENPDAIRRAVARGMGFRCFLRWWWRRTRRQAACGPLNWGRAHGGRSAWYCQRELR